MKRSKHNPDILIPDEVFEGLEGHPACCFFELFQTTANPDDITFGTKFCHMTEGTEEAEQCNGDYLKCPLTKEFKLKKIIREYFYRKDYRKERIT